MSKNRVISVFLLVAIILLSTPAVYAKPKTKDTDDSVAAKFDVNPASVMEITTLEEELVDPIPWNVDMVNAEDLYNEGEGIYVAVLDTGLLSNYLDFFLEGIVDIKEEWGKGFTHDVFYVGSGGQWDDEGKFDYGPLRDDRGFITYDFGNPLWVYYPPDDDWYPYPFGSGHGTHVTSIVTGYHFTRGDVDTWVSGVAPKVTIIPVIVLDIWIAFEPDGTGYMWSGGTDEMVAAGIEYVGDLAKDHGVKIVINMSLGGPTPSPEIEEAIDYAIEQGVIVVASAGNEGEEGMGWPGAYPQVISTAAAGWTQEYGGGYYDYYWWWEDVPEKLNAPNKVYDPINEITYKNNWHTYLTDFSSRPNKDLGQSWKDLDVSAPGAAIRGPYKPYGPYDWGYYAVWGTSQAAPHVSGISALLLKQYNDLDQCQVENVLKHAARKVTMPADGAFVSDVFSDFEVLHFNWSRHDAGYGFLTLDETMQSADSQLKKK